jgi:hypothetical protein
MTARGLIYIRPQEKNQFFRRLIHMPGRFICGYSQVYPHNPQDKYSQNTCFVNIYVDPEDAEKQAPEGHRQKMV